MPDKTAAEKMRLKPGMTAALLHVPPEVVASLGLPNGMATVSDPAGAEFVLEFAATQAEAESRLTALEPDIGAKTVVWVGYPKGSTAAGYDLNRDTIGTFVRTIGLVLVANVAIDAKWSAVRVRRND